MTSSTRSLKVVEVGAPTPQSVRFVLEDPEGAPIEFEPGQFLTLLVKAHGVVHRRAYSICSSPSDSARVALVAKRVKGGVVSNHLADTLEVGTMVSVLGPSGSFVLQSDTRERRRNVLIGGGSGITPLMSMILAALEREPASETFLIYGNRTRGDIIFENELQSLADEHDSLVLRHVLSAPPEGWQGGTGVLDGPTLAAELSRLGLPGRECLEIYFLCGPQAMMEAARKTLMALGVESEQIKEERFLSPHLRQADVERPRTPQKLTVVIDGSAHTILVPPGGTILEAGLDAGLPLGFSCAMGGCAECRLKLVDGEVAMEEPNCLTPDEREAGLVLACVGWPLGPATVEARS